MPGKSFGPKSKGSEKGAFGAGKKPMTKTGKSVPFDAPGRKPPKLSPPPRGSLSTTIGGGSRQNSRPPARNTGGATKQVGKPGFKK